MGDLKRRLAKTGKLLRQPGMSKERLYRGLLHFARRMVIEKMASKAFDKGIPLDQGPVWFDEEAWKTDYWWESWLKRMAYCEGQRARARFESIDANPYHQQNVPFSSLNLKLELAWRCGFKSTDLE